MSNFKLKNQERDDIQAYLAGFTEKHIPSSKTKASMTTEDFNNQQASMPNAELIEKVEAQISSLCKTGAKTFTMSVPPRVDDTDMLLCELVKRYKYISSRPEQTIIPYQCCPKCNGQGTVSRPPHLAGDVYEWSGTATQFQCNVCNGQMIIPQMIIQKQP